MSLHLQPFPLRFDAFFGKECRRHTLEILNITLPCFLVPLNVKDIWKVEDDKCVINKAFLAESRPSK